MEAAAQLMRKGVDTAKITDRTYYEKTYVQNQILGRALLESIMVPVSYTHLTLPTKA